MKVVTRRIPQHTAGPVVEVGSAEEGYVWLKSQAGIGLLAINESTSTSCVSRSYNGYPFLPEPGW